uniref:Alpha-glucosidase n=1 Tax=Kalanchoe fedtschenkoi TaxID=63787 RepID=A0A7N0TA50_KALFE
MGNFKVTKKHHKHLNNPFPSAPNHIPFRKGTVFTTSAAHPSHQLYPIGTDFQAIWHSNENGETGSGWQISIHHRLQPQEPIWSTVPGQAFVSAGCADTEVEESRGSFAIHDRDVHLLCDHQSVDEIRVVDEPDEGDNVSWGLELGEKFDLGGLNFPVLLITGSVFSSKSRKSDESGGDEGFIFVEKHSVSVRYWVLFDQKNSNQIGFHVKFEKPDVQHGTLRSSSNWYSRGWGLRLRMGRIWEKKWTGWCLPFWRTRGFLADSSPEGTEGSDKMENCFEINRVWFTYSSEDGERFYGFGEQFSHIDLKGKRVPIFTQEQGIGRGDQPITLAANLVSYRAGGNSGTTYAPSPFYMTSKMKSLYLEGYNYSVFDLRRKDRVQIQIHGDSVQGRILYGRSPTELIEAYTWSIGRPSVLPEWIISGAVAGMQGGTDSVRLMLERLKSYDVPICAFWLQDWVGRRETIIGSQLWWNWEVDAERYWGWRELIKDLGNQNIKVMTYCNPCLAPADAKPNFRRNLFEEAKELDILVKNKEGGPYMVPNTAFDVGMLDLTHPDSRRWFKGILMDMVSDGVRGWMADFGEGLPVDAFLYSGEDPVSAHNRYPELWAQINREFVEEWKSSCGESEKEATDESLVFFMRAGFRNSPMWCALFWEGDQMVSWQAHDGIKSAVVGLLSSGISGYAFNHSDIGGYCAVNLPIISYKRSEELLLRWMEFSAFTIVFRTHEGNKPSCNSQFYSNHRTLWHFSRFAKVYQAWKFYRTQLVKEASERGLPVCRHLFLHYPNDKRAQSLSHQQFLVGTEILVVPILDKGKKKVKAYFPMGENEAWLHIWTGKLYSQPGREALVEAPLGHPAAFVKAGSTVGSTFLENLKELNLVH